MILHPAFPEEPWKIRELQLDLVERVQVEVLPRRVPRQVGLRQAHCQEERLVVFLFEEIDGLGRK